MAFDCFMWLTGPENGAPTVVGETQDPTYSSNSAFEPISFSFGASNPSSIGSAGGGSGSGKVSISDFSIMKQTDSASANLFLACCNGGHYDQATVVLRRAGGSGDATGTVYLQYDFYEVFVDNIQWSGSSGGSDLPTESISFSFGAVQVTYTPQQSGGEGASPVITAWSVVQNNNTTNVSS
jgi:type VI secretion system secreted protein Hcp